MSEESRKSYTIRLPERIASWLESSATEAGVAPTTLIQSLIIRQYEGSTQSAKDRPAAKPQERSPGSSHHDYELRQQQRHRQLLYEVGKMRAVLLHALDHTLSADSVDEIIEAAGEAASDYIAELLGTKGGQQ